MLRVLHSVRCIVPRFTAHPCPLVVLSQQHQLHTQPPQAMEPSNQEQVHKAVAEYYGKELGHTSDLKTSACLTGGETTAEVARLLRNVHPDVVDRFYGCGSPIPPLLRGKTTLDLGCGTGRDTYILAQLVGPEGTAIGVDFSPEQLAVARGTEAWHANKFGFAKPNTRFLAADIADLRAAGIEDASVDVVVSNCVLNLVPDKLAAFKEVFRVLKPGGELYFSDVYTDRRVPDALQRDKVLWGECLSGALYRGDFARIMRAAGFPAWWTVTSRKIAINEASVAAAARSINFFSETVRACKVAGLEDAGEDYGQSVLYDGSIPAFPHAFTLGAGAVFITGQRTPVDRNTALVLSNTRYASAFRVSDEHAHRGAFRGSSSSSSVMPGFLALTCDAEEDSAAAAACACGGSGSAAKEPSHPVHGACC